MIPRTARCAVAMAAAFAVAGLAATTPMTSSYLYDLETLKAQFEAGEWSVIPAECDDVLKHPHTTIITGTPGDDVLPAPGGTAPPGGDDNKPNYSQVVLGLAGNDVLSGGNQDDCLVGGPGDDLLGGGDHENGKDILLGGHGDDHLVSGNGKDVLIGGAGYDICEGQNGKDTFDASCEVIVHTNGGDAGGDTEDEKGKDKDKGKGGDGSGKSTQPSGPAPQHEPSTEEPDEPLEAEQPQELNEPAPEEPAPDVIEPEVDPEQDTADDGATP